MEDDLGGQCTAGTLQDDNKILLTGYSKGDFLTARFTNTPLGPFVTNGYIITDTTDDQLAGAIDILPNDKIVVVGTAQGNKVTSVYTVAMYNPDGSPVSTFGDNGIMTYEISGADSAYAVAHYILPKNNDTLLVIAGSSDDGKDIVPSAICIDMDGKLITSFGENGYVMMKYAGKFNDLVINNPTGEPDDVEFFAAGELVDKTRQFAVTKMDYRGKLDGNFGKDGIVTQDLNMESSTAQSIVYQKGKKNYVVFAGYGDAKGTDMSFIGRILASDGTPDINFGKDGYSLLDLKALANAQTYSLGIQNYDSKAYYLVGGTAANDYTTEKAEDFFVSRTDMDGRIDETFGTKATPGCRFTNFLGTSPSSLDFGNTVLVQNDGNMVITGHSSFNKAIKFSLVKYIPDASSVDSSFGNNGTIVSNMVDLNTISAEAAMLSDNTVIETGTIQNADKSTDIITAMFENLGLITKHPEDKQVCEKEPVTLSIQVRAGTNYLFGWVFDQDGDGIVDDIIHKTPKPDLNVFSPKEVEKGYYACRVYNQKAEQLAVSNYAFVDVSKIPNVNLGPDEVVCDGGSKTLDAGNAGMDYLWNPGGETTQTKVASATGTYSVTVTNPNNASCKDSDAVGITISFGPTVSLREDTAVCVEDNVSIHLDAGPDGNSYAWNTGQTTQTIDVTEEDNYTVTVTDSDGCTAVDNFTFTVWNTSINFADTTVCNTTVDFYMFASPYIEDPSTTDWCRSGSWISSGLQYNVDQTGEYSVIATDAHGCSTEDTFYVSQSDPPDVELGADTSICKGQNVVLDAQDLNVTPNVSFLWSTGATTQTLDVSSTDNYKVTVANTNCEDRDSAMVTVFESEVHLGNDTSICSGNSLVLDAENAGATFEWNTGETTQTLEVTSDGMYHVTVSYPTTGCISAYDTINVSTYANTVSLELGSDTSICGGSLSLDAENAGAFYLWSTGETSQTISADVTDNYAVTVTNPDNCIGIDDMTLTVDPIPVVDLGSDTSICDGTILQLDAQNSGSDFTWSNAESSQSIDVTTADDYSVTVTNPQGCEESDTITVGVLSVPAVDLHDTVVCPSSLVVFDAENAGDEYYWNTDDTTQIINTFFPGKYIVTVTRANGCIDIDSAVVTHKQPYDDEQICIITTDTATERNLIVWEKTPNENVEEYFVYRETVISGSYSFLGSVPFGETSVFVDSTADPSQQQYIYKITSVDSCGNESSLDSAISHKTLLLQYSGSTEGINLLWQKYEIDGEPLIFDSYHIYRGTDSLGLEFYTQVSGNTFAFIDKDQEALNQRMYYRVYGIFLSDQCYADAKLKASAGPFSQAISNMEDNRLKGSDIQEMVGDVNLTIYPNPCDEMTNITVSGQNNIQTIEIYDCIGKKVSTISPVNNSLYRFTVNGLPAGIYLVGVTLDNGSKGYNKLIIK